MSIAPDWGRAQSTGPQLALSGPPPVGVRPADPRARFMGAFEFVGGERERAGVRAAIEHVISQMSFIAAPFARGPLRERNPVFPRVSIQLRGGQVVVAFPTVRFASAESGAETPGRTEFGENVHISHRFEPDRMVEIIRADSGTRRNDFLLSPDGNTLTMRVNMSSPRLPTAIRYALTYRRH
jgi:hypothetical protein